MDNCLWCQKPIAQNFLAKRAGLFVPYQACDKDCAHGIDVVENIDRILFKTKKPFIGEHVISYEGNNGYDALITAYDFKTEMVTVKFEDDTTTIIPENEIEYIERQPIDDEPLIAFI